MMKLQKACRNYVAWKAKHAPELKPWLNPEQSSLPQLNPSDIGKWELSASPALDEREAIEVVATSADADEDDDSAGVNLRSPELLEAVAASNDGQPSTTAEVPLAAAAEPAIPDMAVAASAN